MKNKIIFIGGGNMAKAIFAKLDLTNFSIHVIQRNPHKREKLQREYPHIIVHSELTSQSDYGDLIILAVKPQDAKIACQNIKNLIQSGTIVSVMAGIDTKTIHSWLGNKSIIRVMPNTPSSLGMGVSGIYFTNSVKSNARQVIENIFANLGKTYIFADEDFIDKMAAVGGSSPAYVFYFIEQMIDSAINQFGFSETDAREITLQVFNGAIAMIKEKPDLTIEELRANVTSKKGTTEQAIKVMTESDLKGIIFNAEQACYARALELKEFFK